MESEEKTIRQWISEHEDEFVHDLEELVSIPSVSHPQESTEEPYGKACHEAMEYMIRKGTEYGLKVRNRDAGCFQLEWEPENGCDGQTSDQGGRDHASLGVWSHLDVVPEGEGWHYPPYQPTIRDGFMIGRGVSDNKGSAVGTLYAVRCLKELGYHLPYPLYLGYGTSEENGMLALKKWLRSHRAPDYNLVADCGFPVCYGEQGNLVVRFSFPRVGSEELTAGTVTNMVPAEASWRDGNVHFETKGRSAHVMSPENGMNALHELALTLLHPASADTAEGSLDPHLGRMWEFIEVMTRDGHGIASGLNYSDTLSGQLVGQITVARTMGDHFELEADFRYPIMEGGKLSDGTRLIGKLEDLSSRYRAAMTICSNAGPAYYPKESLFVKELMESYRHVTGSAAEPFVMSGGTYARILPNSVTYGGSLEHKQLYHEEGWPKGAGDCHQSDESVKLSELYEAIAIWCLTFLSLSL